VVCRSSVLEAVHAHGQETRDVEVCGVLVGNIHRDQGGPYLWIEAAIRGEHASNLAAQVTFTSATWTYIHEEIEKHPGKRIVGWYHTHPDFGIFLSAADLFIHENFFAQPWQVALVFDPIRQEEGLFVWRQGQARLEPLHVQDGNDSLATIGHPQNCVSPVTHNEAAFHTRKFPTEYSAPATSLRPQARNLLLLLTAAMVAVVSWLAVHALLWPEMWQQVAGLLSEFVTGRR
jgi:proteasome lid subunit RPN8/RPN11